MIYTTGTIAGSGNTLTGTGTNFTAAGTLIRNGCTVIVLTSPPQAFQITGVTSATQLAVSPAVNPAIPAGTRYAILLSDSLSVDGLALDIAETFKMYQAYMGGFADVMQSAGTVTITIDGKVVSVPGMQSVVQKGGNGAVPISLGGTGETTLAAAKRVLGSDTVNGMSGGVVNSTIRVPGGQDIGINTGGGGNKQIYMWNAATDIPEGNYINFIRGHWYDGNWTIGGVRGGTTNLDRVQITVASGFGQTAGFEFYPDGRAVGNWQALSDERIKEVHGRIEHPLDKMRKIRGLYWTRLDTGLTGYGFTAQDVQEVFPDAVNKAGTITLKDGTVIKDVLSPDTYGVSAALHHEAILALMDGDEKSTARLNNMEAFLKTMGYDPDTDYIEPEPEPENQ